MSSKIVLLDRYTCLSKKTTTRTGATAGTPPWPRHNAFLSPHPIHDNHQRTQHSLRSIPLVISYRNQLVRRHPVICKGIQSSMYTVPLQTFGNNVDPLLYLLPGYVAGTVRSSARGAVVFA